MTSWEQNFHIARLQLLLCTAGPAISLYNYTRYIHYKAYTHITCKHYPLYDSDISRAMQVEEWHSPPGSIGITCGNININLSSSTKNPFYHKYDLPDWLMYIYKMTFKEHGAKIRRTYKSMYVCIYIFICKIELWYFR